LNGLYIVGGTGCALNYLIF